MTAHAAPLVDAPAHVALRTRDLAVGYRTRRTRRAVLEHVNLAVHAGELVCLLGPNGIGKSTLLRTLAKMQPALWGTVELGGAELGSITHAELARRLGVVLTERVAVEALPARRIVELGRYPHSGWFGRLNDADRRVVDWAIDAVGARHLAERDFSRLSDGERQRVMIARALAQEPGLLVLDEPTVFLDVPSRVELMGLLRQLTRDGHLAVVVSTHDLELALRMADVVWLVMPGGELLTGAPEDVVMAGGIAQAFEGRQIRFHAEERSFRWLTGDRGAAVVRGAGLRAAMVKAVLEREGYAVVAAASEQCELSVDAHASGWRVSADGGECDGADFASLAAFLRGRRTVT
ncbi:MAG: ABC transporter ATP-binding protein [Vicinamibacterales bacterium]